MSINTGIFSSTTDLWETPKDFLTSWMQNSILTWMYALFQKMQNVQIITRLIKMDSHRNGKASAGAILRMAGR